MDGSIKICLGEKHRMRLTEYVHWLTRDDIGMSTNPKADDYTHLAVRTVDKRARYLYQCKLKGREPVK